MSIKEKYYILEGESEESYRFRMYKLREADRLTWQETANIINEVLEQNFSESKYRKEYAAYKRGYDERDKEEEISPEISELMQAKIELAKERVKMADERIQTNAYIRQLAREETIKEIAQQAAQSVGASKLLPDIGGETTTGWNAAILELSDWHYGIECDNFWNKFNPDIAKERIGLLLSRVIEYCKLHNVNVIHVMNLSDLIAGRIHLSLRLESRFDVITQTIQVSEILAEFLNNLRNAGLLVHYYDCLDNHSRLEPNKKDAIDLESLARIIPWYLKERLQDKICIHANEYGDDIITFNVMGYEVLGVHGDKDKPATVVDNLSMMTHKHYHLVCTAHLHHFSADEKNETLVISNGSLMGTDTYAKNLRLSSKPSQNLIIVTERSIAECVYRITLN